MRISWLGLGLGFAALGASLHLLTTNVFPQSHWQLRLLALMGVEVPGLDLPLSEIPNQVTADGRPQVLVYGPENCPPARALMSALDQQGIPYLFRNASRNGGIDQAELGAVILAADSEPSQSTAIVLVNGKVLANPTLPVIEQAYQQAVSSSRPL